MGAVDPRRNRLLNGARMTRPVEAANTTIEPLPDRVIERIGDLCDHDLDWFTGLPQEHA